MKVQKQRVAIAALTAALLVTSGAGATFYHQKEELVKVIIHQGEAIDQLKAEHQKTVATNRTLVAELNTISAKKQELETHVKEKTDAFKTVSKQLVATHDELDRTSSELDRTKEELETVKKNQRAATVKAPQNKRTVAKAPSSKTLTVKATAYTAYCKGCSGITKTGQDLRSNPGQKVIAVDPSVIPLGSQVYVEGYGTALAGDTGGAIKGNRIDIFMPSESNANEWGVRHVEVKILN